MTTPNYFKQESDRLIYGSIADAVSTPVIIGFAKNGSWNIENIEHTASDASLDFVVGNIRKFSLSKVVGIFTDDGSGVVEQTTASGALDFFTLP
jgi:hypothetical protein